MTTRDDARRTATSRGPRACVSCRRVRTEDRRSRSRWPTADRRPGSGPRRGAAAREPSDALPERLYAARERKGVDLYRAERDTKIRARYLAALERGEYGELPGDVYTKGFLRNYALYLGLDPEEVVGQWRRERGDAACPARPSSPFRGRSPSPGRASSSRPASSSPPC